MWLSSARASSYRPLFPATASEDACVGRRRQHHSQHSHNNNTSSHHRSHTPQSSGYTDFLNRTTSIALRVTMTVGENTKKTHEVLVTVTSTTIKPTVAFNWTFKESSTIADLYRAIDTNTAPGFSRGWNRARAVDLNATAHSRKMTMEGLLKKGPPYANAIDRKTVIDLDELSTNYNLWRLVEETWTVENTSGLILTMDIPSRLRLPRDN
ncbi:hypothetical protein GE09DRAFT_1070253 [Coniochaeta sp. 2T2.1]|nr:hypothetical protein GE09DRAFT_1070253 [Coniochaeta sp. 2T2.1]